LKELLNQVQNKHDLASNCRKHKVEGKGLDVAQQNKHAKHQHRSNETQQLLRGGGASNTQMPHNANETR